MAHKGVFPIKLKALVIDDSRVMRSMVMDSLKKTNLGEFEFVEAGDGLEALTKFQADLPDIVFADWNMPKMTGIEFVRRVRASKSHDHIPIVMVTSEKTMGKVEEAIDRAGVNAYITKPFTVPELEKKLSRLVSNIADYRRKAAAKSSGGFFSRLLGGG